MLNAFWEAHHQLLRSVCCGVEMDRRPEGLACRGCGRPWPARHGFPLFVSDAPHQDFYDTTFWGGRRLELNSVDAFYLQVLEDWLKLLGLKEGDRYLDVSCGEGHSLWTAERLGALAVGTDFSMTALMSAERKFDVQSMVLCPAEALPFPDGSFDALSCLGSLEHYPDPAGALREFRRVTTRRARMLVVVPNRRHILLPILNMVDRQPIVTRLDLEGWKRFLDANGLRMIGVEPDNHTYYRPLSPLRIRGIFRRMLAPIASGAGLQRAWQFAFLCEKKDVEVQS
jgi:SAM-dependent methyltransferase